jgi:hypothetical protein
MNKAWCIFCFPEKEDKKMQTVIRNMSGKFAAVVLLVAMGCAVTDIDKTADFSKYKTFAWGKTEINVDNPVYKSDLIRKRIKEVIETEFAKRGIVANKRQPDFIVSYNSFTEKKEETTHFHNRYPFFPYTYFGWGGAWAYPLYGWNTLPHKETFTEGTIVIDITDARTQSLVWRGTVSGKLTGARGLQKQIEKGVRAIMKKYPLDPQEHLMPDGKDKVIS